MRPAYVPDEVDHAARDLAAAALAGDREGTQRSLAALEAFDVQRAAARGDDDAAADTAPTGLVPVARDLAAAADGDPRSYRAHARALLERDDLDPALRARLEQSAEDDPLALADARIRDAYVGEFAQVFNAIVEPVATSFTRGIYGLVAVGRSLVGLAVVRHVQDDMSIPERQALVHWKRFLAETPDAPEAADVETWVRDAQVDWNTNEADRAKRRARNSLREGRNASALVSAQRALGFVPEDGEATRLRDEAQAKLRESRADRARSLGAPATLRAGDLAAQRELALALWRPDADVRGAAERTIAAAGETPLADEGRFVLAMTQEEDASWDALEAIAEDDGAMSRHAAALVTNAQRNPYDAFLSSRTADRAEQVGWVIFGPLVAGPRKFDLPRPVEWLIEAPGYLSVVTTLPNRLVRYPWLAPWPFGRAPAAHARSYLRRYPEGAHAEELRDWLSEFEADRGNWAAALSVADPERVDPGRLGELRENAARQALDTAKRERRRDARQTLTREVAREFHDTAAGREAGAIARAEAQAASAQRIQISRGFLRENPRVRGPEALGLPEVLVDDSLRNGELHPEGVRLLGGRTVEICLVEGDDEDRPPKCERRTISNERLARLVALLDETTQRNALLDPDDSVGSDADRDRYFEQARLGVADTVDPRATAQSTYAYTGLRERYGLVRGRESILPVELVVQGSFPDLGLGAFPRIKKPKPTPDAALYR